MPKSTISQKPPRAGLMLALVLVAGVSCSNDIAEPNPPPRYATLQVANHTTGGALDPDGYQVVINQVDRGPLELNTTLELPGLTPGQLSVELHGLAGNCVAAEGDMQTVVVAAGESARVVFTIQCTAPAELSALRLVFARDDGLYTMAADGSGVTQLAVGEFHGLAVSPDGQWIAFSRGLDLHVIRADGSGLRQITTYGWDPAWSPDGTRLVYAGPRGLLTIALAGGDPVRLTTGGYYDDAPAWSPDGSRIAFDRGDGIEYPVIWLANSDGSGELGLTAYLNNAPSFWASWSPLWSPDGSRLAFIAHNSKSQITLFVMQADGSEVRVLDSGDYKHRSLSDWSPDGRWIAFTKYSGSEYPRPDIYLASAVATTVRTTADGRSHAAAFLRH